MSGEWSTEFCSPFSYTYPVQSWPPCLGPSCQKPLIYREINVTWCVLVFPSVWGFEPRIHRKSDSGEEGVRTLTSCHTWESQPAGLTDGEPPGGSSRVPFFVSLKNSRRMKKVEQTGPLPSSADPRGRLSFNMTVTSVLLGIRPGWCGESTESGLPGPSPLWRNRVVTCVPLPGMSCLISMDTECPQTTLVLGHESAVPLTVPL